MKFSSYLLTAFFLFSAGASLAQRDVDQEEKPLISQDEIDDLLMWMVDGKYEKVLYKAIRYTEDDKTKKEPLPYIYMSQAFFRISESDDAKLLEQYKGALKSALKYCSKFVKKDKEKTYFYEFTDYINELRRATMNQAEIYVDDLKFTKAKSYYKYLYTFDLEDPGAHLMYGTVLWKNKTKRDAQIAWEKARQLLLDQQGRGLQEVQLDLLRYAIIYTAETMDEEGNRTGAIEWLDLGEELFGSQKEYGAVRRSIEG
jgi:hypothetical protein